MLNFSVSDGHKFSVFIFSSWQNKGILNETVIAYKLDSTTGLIPHSLNYKTVEIVSFNFLETFWKTTVKFITEHSKIPGEKAILNKERKTRGKHSGTIGINSSTHPKFPWIGDCIESARSILCPNPTLVRGPGKSFHQCIFFPTEVAASFSAAIVNLLCLEGRLLLSQKNEVT